MGGGGNNWIFCELFSPTEIYKNGLSAKSLKPDSKITASSLTDFNANRIFYHHDYCIYHPVKSTYATQLKQEIANLTLQNQALQTQLDSYFINKIKKQLKRRPKKIINIDSIKRRIKKLLH